MKYLIIGAGVIGTAIARELAIQNKGEIVVLEKEVEAGLHTSGRNSGVIHSGINPKSGTLKSKLCIEGSRLLREYCLENKVPMSMNGTIVVANSREGIMHLHQLYDNAMKSQVPGVRLISQEELMEREPNAKGLEALFSPTGAVIDSKALVQRVVKDAQSNGVKFYWNTKVNKINTSNLEASTGIHQFDFLINCSGLHVDKLAHTIKIGNKYSIIPFRGDYREVPANVNSMIYHVPDLRFPFLGVHLTRTVDGKVIAGPTATLSFAGREGYEGGLNPRFFSETANSVNFLAWATRAITSPSMLKQIVHNLQISKNPEKFLKDIYQIYDGDIDMSKAHPYSSGIRPQIVDRKGHLVDDFLIERNYNQLHLLNAVSPAFTASLAFAKYIIKEYIK